MIPELLPSPPTPHSDHSGCDDPRECLVEALTQQADRAVTEHRLARREFIQGHDFHTARAVCSKPSARDDRD